MCKGKSLSALAGLNKTVVIYIINPSHGAKYIRQLCRIFQRTFHAYASAVRTIEEPSDIVLQLLPIGCVASDFNIMIPKLSLCTRIAKIIYDKCPLTQTAKSPYASGAAFQIAESLPKKLDFKLTSSDSYNPLKQLAVAHLGYYWEPQDRWLTAALINDTADRQWTASYHLGRGPHQMPHLAMVLEEIWKIVNDAIDFVPDDGRVYIAKTSLFLAEEIQSTCAIFLLHAILICSSSLEQTRRGG